MSSDASIIAAFILAIGAVLAALITGWFMYVATGKKTKNRKFNQTKLNTHEKDYPLVNLSNVSKHGHGNSEWKLEETGKAGDQIGICIYYHNSGKEVAEDLLVKLHVKKSSDEENCYLVGALLSCENVEDEVIDFAKLYVPKDSLVYFATKPKWRVGSSLKGNHVFPYHQNGYELYEKKGLNLGRIGTGFSHQGTVITNLIITNPVGSGATYIYNS